MNYDDERMHRIWTTLGVLSCIVASVLIVIVTIVALIEIS